MLLLGLSQEDCTRVRGWVQQMEPGFVASPCPAALLDSATLQQVLTGGTEGTRDTAAAAGDGTAGSSSSQGSGSTLAQYEWEAVPPSFPPVVFFSGMQGAEVLAIIQHWRECTGEATAGGHGLLSRCSADQVVLLL